MALDLEALKLSEIERGVTKPIPFGDIATGAVSTGLQFQQAQEVSAESKQKREKAAMMQQLLNGGQNALFAAINKLEPEEQALIVGGDKNTLQSITDNPEGLVEGWKMLSEVLARKEGVEPTDFSGKVEKFARHGLITPKEELTLTKPKEGETVRLTTSSFSLL